MKNGLRVGLCAGAMTGAAVLLSGLGAVGRVAGPGEQDAARPSGVPVVVELFTAEGCSSCPPADALLAKLESQQPVSGAEVIALEEHVDYWNNGGWIDPFSSYATTLRQQEYAAALKSDNPYTPQMVVDGQQQFVGSREEQARKAIEGAASGKKAQVTVASAGGEKYRVNVAATGEAGSDRGGAPEVWMAVTETGLHSNVRAGENSGQDLHHAAVVRKLWRIGAVKEGGPGFSSEQAVKLDRAWKRENLRVVVFVQEKKSKRILGAGAVRIAQS